jgi:hypothetical protein
MADLYSLGVNLFMPNDRVFAMSFAGVYPHYVAKAERKGRTKGEVDVGFRWLTVDTNPVLAKKRSPMVLR